MAPTIRDYLRNDEPAAKGMSAVDTCLSVLECFSQTSGSMTLKEVAIRIGTPPSTAHRYLQSMVAKGMIEQSPRTRRYNLGISALRLGLAALGRIDLLSRANENLIALAQETKLTCYSTVLSDQGPVIVHIERGDTYLGSLVQVGSRKPIWTSSTGHCLMAFTSMHVVRPILIRELAALAIKPSEEDIWTCINGIRKQGYAKSCDEFGTSVTSISAPVINTQNEACAAITVLAPSAVYPKIETDTIRRLLNFCESASP